MSLKMRPGTEDVFRFYFIPVRHTCLRFSHDCDLEVNEAFGGQLMQAVPLIRRLRDASLSQEAATAFMDRSPSLVFRCEMLSTVPLDDPLCRRPDRSSRRNACLLGRKGRSREGGR